MLHERMVRNKKYDSKNERKATGKAYRANFADKIQALCSMVTNDYLVKSVTVNSGRVPHVVLCSEQLNEIKALCFDKQCGSVLSFDKTYNLGSLYVTVGGYRNTGPAEDRKWRCSYFYRSHFYSRELRVRNLRPFLQLLAHPAC